MKNPVERIMAYRAKMLAAMLAALVLAAGMATDVAAGKGPHFGKVSAGLASPDLVVSFKEVGLRDLEGEMIDYEVTADATAIYACINPGGNPVGQPVEVSEQVGTSASFLVVKGKVDGTFPPISPPVGSLDCSPHTEGLIEVHYDNIQIEDTTNGVTKPAKPSSIWFVL